MAETLQLDALARFLRQHLPDAGGIRSARRIGGGQSNPTFVLDTGARQLVLRKRPAGSTLPGAHAIDREFRVLGALAGTDLPVPKPILYHPHADVLDTDFYLMEWVEGRVFPDGALPGLSPAERRAIYLSMAETLARLHAVDPAAVGLGDFGPPGDYFLRQLRRWSRQWETAEDIAIPDLDALRDWLAENLPPDDGVRCIAHGDYRMGNLLIHPTEPRVVAVLDWELATLGHPLADLGFCCMAWHTDPEEYGGIAGIGDIAPGIPTEAEFVARYRAHARPTPALTAFHIAFALFRFAVIFVGIGQRAAAGTAASERGAALAPLAARFARRGLDVARGTRDATSS